MSRKQAREIALHLIFEMGFFEFNAEQILENRLDKSVFKSISEEVDLYKNMMSKKQLVYIKSVVNGVAKHVDEFDEIIEKNAKGWSVKRISRITKAVLRLALYEMKYMNEVPVGVAINEAVELAKKYETKDTGSFVNGILGTVSRTLSDCK